MTSTRRVAVAISSMLGLLPLHANAQFASMEGTYTSSTVTLKVIVLDDEKGVAAASLVVAAGGCSGSIAGVGSIAAKKLQFASFQKVENGGACRISVQFDKASNQASISDNGQCSMFRGASCEWDGETARKVRERKR